MMGVLYLLILKIKEETHLEFDGKPRSDNEWNSNEVLKWF